MKTPPLAERERPGLSETLPGPVHPHVCQSCGAEGLGLDGDHEALTRWRECDAWDKPTMRVVVLCLRCSKKLIDKHPRLYISLQQAEPFPGSMEICVPCKHRDGVSCKCPIAKHNGGSGMRIDGGRAISAFLCPGGLSRMWTSPPTDCWGLHAE